MEKLKKGDTREVVWEEVQDIFQQIHPVLYQIIKRLPLSKKHTLIRCRYPFGAKIIHKGILHLANPEGHIVPLSDNSIDAALREKLSYRSVPTAVFSHNLSEVYFPMEHRLISLNVFMPGYMMGLWELLDPPLSYLAKQMWSVNAGARTMLMVPKITDSEGHSILQKMFGVPRKLSKTFYDHWEIFKSIANHPNFSDDWYCEIIIFTFPWVKSMQTQEKGWGDFENYLLKEAWQQSSYWRNKVTYDLIWEIFIANLTHPTTKLNPYDVYTAKHIALVSMGVLPGLKPATDNMAAPDSGLQEIFAKYYGLKIYVPTIMVPYHFSLADSNIPVYYSLTLPTLLETALKSKNYPSLLTNLREVRWIVEKFREESLSGNLPIKGTPLFDFVRKTQLGYFHSEAFDEKDIKNSSEMADADVNLIFYSNRNSHMRFSDKSRFVKGCIKISYK